VGTRRFPAPAASPGAWRTALARRAGAWRRHGRRVPVPDAGAGLGRRTYVYGSVRDRSLLVFHTCGNGVLDPASRDGDQFIGVESCEEANLGAGPVACVACVGCDYDLSASHDQAQLSRCLCRIETRA
jgi:hypothetical protein